MTGRHRMGAIAAASTLLAAAPLAAIYERYTWLFQSLVVVVVAAVAAAAARALRAPVWAQPPAMLLGLLVALTWLFPSGGEILAVLPGPGTFPHFMELTADAPAAMRTNSLPAPDDDALLFVTALGIGLVAVVVDLFTVGMRRPALAGLPMLAIYSVPVAVRSSAVPPVPFVIGAAGYLWLLGSDNLDRVRRFGRRFTGDGQGIDAWEPSPLAAAGRRLTVIGVVVAVLLPLAVPGLSGVIGRVPGGFGAGYGSGPGSGEVNLFAELTGRLRQDDTTPMLRVTTNDTDPFYLRFAVASEINETGFAPSPPGGVPLTQLAEEASPGPPRPDEDPPAVYHASVEITDAYNMPMAPTYATLVRVAGLDREWLYDPDQQIVFSRQARAAGLRYEFDFARLDYSPDHLRAAPPLPGDHPMRRFAEVPDVPEVAALVDRLTEGADTPYDQVRALFAHFSARNGFRYSLETGPETTGVAIVDFLENKIGFCVQYATALAWMVRTAGIPARVAFGFTRGTDRPQRAFTLTNRNLHAWTEVYFAGVGWVPFDATPTASVRGGVDSDWAPHPDSPEARPNAPAPSPGTAPTAAPGGDPLAEEPLPAGGSAGEGDGSNGPGSRWWVVAVAAVLLIPLLSWPGVHRSRLRRRRLGTRAGRDPRERAHDAWDELLDTMEDLRLGLDPTETPRATAARLVAVARLDGAAAESARLLALAEERGRYAREPLAPDGIAEAARVVERALTTTVRARVRWRARLLPPSVVNQGRRVVSSTMVGAGSAVARLSGALSHLSPRRLLHRPRASA